MKLKIGFANYTFNSTITLIMYMLIYIGKNRKYDFPYKNIKII